MRTRIAAATQRTDTSISYVETNQRHTGLGRCSADLVKAIYRIPAAPLHTPPDSKLTDPAAGSVGRLLSGAGKKGDRPARS